MAGIFISYRRIDSRVYAGRLFDRLARHFGRDLVFMDVEGGIARGDDFASTIDTAVASVGAMVVVIGRQWLTCTDDHSCVRLQNADDWVRTELRTALARSILVLPVLVDGASMPTANDLPEELRPFARRQAAEITDSRWNYDVNEIIKTLEHKVKPGPLRERPPSRLPRVLKYVAGALAAVVLAIAALLAWDTFFAARPADYGFSIEPPAVRIRWSGATTVPLTLTNTGKRPAPFTIDPLFYTATPSEGVLRFRDDTCKMIVAVGATCTVTLVFDPQYFTGDESTYRFNGALSILAYGNGRQIPLTIERAPETSSPAVPPGR